MPGKMTKISVLLAAGIAVGSVAHAQLYETSFESSGDPSGFDYSLGALADQDGWTLEAGDTVEVTNTNAAADGSNYVQQAVDTVITRQVPNAETADVVLFRGYYYGEGSDELFLPADTAEHSAIIGFKKESPSTFLIGALDGRNDSGDPIAAYRFPSGGMEFSNTEWHEVILRIDFNTRKFDVNVNNEPYIRDIDFFKDTVTHLSGVKSSSRSGSKLDRMGFFASTADGDYDNDGLSDYDEMRRFGGNPLDPNQPPPPTPTPSPTATPLPPTPTPTATPLPPTMRQIIEMLMDERGTLQSADRNRDGAVDAADVVEAMP